MISPIWNGKVENGKLVLANLKLFYEYIRSLNGEVQVIIKQRRKLRSENQNAWYWACVVGIPAIHFGYTSQEMHEAFKYMFLRYEEQGKPPRIKSSANLTTSEFSEYCEQIRAWCSTENIIIPDPDSVFIS